jgi:hypothetical protein
VTLLHLILIAMVLALYGVLIPMQIIAGSF